MSERRVQDEIRAKLLKHFGIIADKTWGNAMNPGVPDLFCGSYWIEVKAKGKKLRPSQVSWCEKWEPHGTRIYVCDDAARLLEMLDGPPNWRAYAPARRRSSLPNALKAWSS